MPWKKSQETVKLFICILIKSIFFLDGNNLLIKEDKSWKATVTWNIIDNVDLETCVYRRKWLTTSWLASCIFEGITGHSSTIKISIALSIGQKLDIQLYQCRCPKVPGIIHTRIHFSGLISIHLSGLISLQTLCCYLKEPMRVNMKSTWLGEYNVLFPFLYSKLGDKELTESLLLSAVQVDNIVKKYWNESKNLGYV